MENWKNLTDTTMVHEAIQSSYEKPIVFFKHSTTCGISHSVKSKIEMDYPAIDGKVDFYYLDLLAYRPISNEIAKATEVTHQSPQVIALKDGEVIYNASHSAINLKKLAEKL